MVGERTSLARDFVDLLRAFADRDVRFLIVGAYALAVHGRPRATGDLDLGSSRAQTMRRARLAPREPSARPWPI
jgi:hypothetical protein